LTVLTVLTVATASRERFAKYPKIEAYEVRPGILMMPRYTATDEVCEIGLEKLHYSPELIRLDSALTRDEINQILDELVPTDERGKPSERATMTESGPGLITTMDFENVSIQIYGATSPSTRKNDIRVNEVAARVKWKLRICR
jgi:hypothetical protein